MVKRRTKLGSLRTRPVGIGLCDPIDRRLDQLLVLAREAGRPATRQLIVGALIRESPTAADEIARMLDRYLDAMDIDVLIPGVPAPSRDAVKKPGRRAR